VLPVAAASLLVAGMGGAQAQDSQLYGTIDPLLLQPLAEAEVTSGSTAPEAIARSPYEPSSAGTESPDSGAGIFDPSILDSQAGEEAEGTGTAPPASAPAAAPARIRREAAAGAAGDAARQADVPVPEERDDDTLATATVRESAIGRETALADPLRAEAENTAIERPPRRPREDNPFAPVGLRLGTFNVFPAIEQGIQTTIEDGESTVSSRTTLRLDARSDWSRHSMNMSGFLTYEAPFSGESSDEFEFGGDLNAAVGFAGGFRGTFDASINRARESASSPIDLTATADRPYRTVGRAAVGLEHDAGLINTGVNLSAERAQYDDGTLTDGTRFSQEDRNNTLFTARLRAGYELSPALRPFIEGEIGRRIYDLDTDRSGFARDADRLGLRAGVAFDIGEKLNGEVSAGWISETFEDDRLDSVSGLRLASTLNWSPERGTSVFANLRTDVEGTTVPGSSGSLLYNAELGFSREVLENLIAEGRVGFGYRDFSGSSAHDIIYTAEAGGTWWMNRYLGFNARARYERTDASESGRNTDTISIFAGIRAQR
jgi:hypothetical protein